ncbi:transposase [Moraxella osloensis]|nr:transposase [Moraxella osloensis]
MSGKPYLEEFKIEAVKQVTEKGYSVAEVATRLVMTTHNLYVCLGKKVRSGTVQANQRQGFKCRTC